MLESFDAEAVDDIPSGVVMAAAERLESGNFIAPDFDFLKAEAQTVGKFFD